MEISFLLGAGFSIPEGYPKTEDINKRLGKIDENGISIYTGGACWFAGKGEAPRYNTGEDTERLFIQEFLKFYNKEILKEKERFHYEKFFDFYTDLIRNISSAETTAKFKTFLRDFDEKKGYTSLGNNLMSFDKHFNQLLADFFRKEGPQLKYSFLTNPYPGSYSGFLNYLEYLKNKYEKIHIHTLNHDLLMERLSISDAMINDFSDGFSEILSPYYTENRIGQSIRLELFKNKFDKKFCLYKLHGSLNQYFISYKRKENRIKDMVRVKRATIFGKLKVVEENRYRYIDKFYNPDFLSGIKEKKRNYTIKCYYKPVFGHFKENLEKSDNLIVIGYSLGDAGINNYIEEYFLSKKDSKMLIIDIEKVNSPIYNNPNVIYFGEGLGVQDINIERISKLLDLN
jgi:hypothetical protein